jgi:aerotaxis receptor
MRKNLPVNNVETVIPDDTFIYSRTNLKGVIEEANEAFASISGYTREEMIGQPHNMVRHPDMPEEAFADMWADLKSGRPWRGVVKNRRKDGGYYWVIANASPVRENGQVVGYQSVRSRPSRDEIAAADAAYAVIRNGSKSLRIEHGRVARRRPAVVEWFASLPVQLMIVALLLLIPIVFDVIADVTGWKTLHEIGHGLALFGGAYALYFLLWYVPHLVRDLEGTAAFLDSVLSSGNLKTRFDLGRRDVIGVIARRADKFVSSIQATVQGMADTARQVETATHEVDAGIKNVHRSAIVQSEATQAAAAAVEEVTVSIGEVASHAGSTKEVAHEAGAVAREGEALSSRATDTIRALAERVKTSAGQVETLGERSAEISRIAAVIREIADQTNLLALNAAIEAARAGEQGRGFAVVADEVRKLAERTGTATQEINAMIVAIQSETDKAVGGMREGAVKVEESVGLVVEAQESLRRINEQMENTVGMVAEISHSSAEQQKAMVELAQNVERVSAMTEQNVAVVDQTEAMVSRLEATVDRMRKAATQYRV